MIASVPPDFLANEMMRQVQEGYVSRAAALLSSPGMAPVCSSTASKLRDLWSTPQFAPVDPWSPPPPLVEAEIRAAMSTRFEKSPRTAARGSGAGLSGWRFEFLFPLLRAPRHVWTPVVGLFTNVALGSSPAWVADVLALGRASALKVAISPAAFMPIA